MSWGDNEKGNKEEVWKQAKVIVTFLANEGNNGCYT